MESLTAGILRQTALLLVAKGVSSLLPTLGITGSFSYGMQVSELEHEH
jgi:hypothetical protein